VKNRALAAPVGWVSAPPTFFKKAFDTPRSPPYIAATDDVVSAGWRGGGLLVQPLAERDLSCFSWKGRGGWGRLFAGFGLLGWG
jgi:hypothetical protein